MSLLDSYEAVLWKTMDWLRITDSVRRKMLAAVAIQFSVAIGLFGLPFVLSGTVLTAIRPCCSLARLWRLSTQP